MLKKKITRAEEVEAAKVYLKTLSINDLSTEEKRALARTRYEHGKKFLPTAWGKMCLSVIGKRPKKQTKRRKRRVKGKQATAQPVTSDNSTVVPMAGRTIDTGSAADGLIRMQRVLPGLIKLIQQTEETVAALTGEEQ